MSDHTKPNTASMKFTPMPMSTLLAMLPLQSKESSDDSNYTSEEDEQDSFSAKTVAENTVIKEKDVLLPNQINDHKEILPSTPKPKENPKIFASEKKFIIKKEHNKENFDQSLRTYPNRNNDNQKCLLRTSEVKKPSALRMHPNFQSKKVEPPFKSPDVKVLLSSQKSKPSTPKIKSGIRRFTPGSTHRSQKKTPLKLIPSSINKESVRCKIYLFL